MSVQINNNLAMLPDQLYSVVHNCSMDRQKCFTYALEFHYILIHLNSSF